MVLHEFDESIHEIQRKDRVRVRKSFTLDAILERFSRSTVRFVPRPILCIVLIIVSKLELTVHV